MIAHPGQLLAWQQGGDTAAMHEQVVFRFLHAPALWVTALVVFPAAVLFAYWAYSGLQRLERPTRIVLSLVRLLAIALCCLLLFQP
ncbi:MAG TPA: hypothetical protein VK348_13800, partial [Planctomycetota bacterium]|nr:hypothetical protein [Planctomycetota bacterium]